ncbi:uncharacterized protein [Gossypium hirsutum]|uniref:Uncharacterized protein n=1 Tax=Gossypium hirsutum TaxID=3635 RepID=A0A1U8JP77_GOSHI|nr:uncharacterized protein LOC107907305 [Gossypium hirsutum]
MSLSTFRKLGIGHMKPTAVKLQLVDRSSAQPEGKIKDILVRVNKFIFPVDFIILDCEANMEVHITDKHVAIRIFESIQGKDKEECHTVNVLDDLIEAKFNDQHIILSMEFAVTSNDEFEMIVTAWLKLIILNLGMDGRSNP